jgi:hypothetical protein
VYVDIEASINRSHEDQHRLTRVDSRIRLKHRLEMMDNLWKLDPQYMMRYRKEIEHEELALAFALLKRHLEHNDKLEMLAVWNRISRLSTQTKKLQYMMALVLSRAPGASRAFNSLRKLRSRILKTPKP